MEKCKNLFLSIYQKTVHIPREPSESQFTVYCPTGSHLFWCQIYANVLLSVVICFMQYVRSPGMGEDLAAPGCICLRRM